MHSSPAFSSSPLHTASPPTLQYQAALTFSHAQYHEPAQGRPASAKSSESAMTQHRGDDCSGDRTTAPVVTTCVTTLVSVTAAAACPKFRLKSPNFIYKSSKIVYNFGQNSYLPADLEVLLVRTDLPSRNPAAADLARHVLTPRAQLRAQTEGKAPERTGGL